MSKKVILNGEKSDWYKSATFILRDEGAPTNYPKNLESYAEDLIENYLKRGGKVSSPNSSSKWIDTFFFMSIALLILVSSMWLLLIF